MRSKKNRGEKDNSPFPRSNNWLDTDVEDPFGMEYNDVNFGHVDWTYI